MLVLLLLTYRELRKTDLAVMLRLMARKAAIGELGAAGTARYASISVTVISYWRPTRS